MMNPPSPPRPAKISVRGLTMAYGSLVVMHDLNFDIGDKDIFVIIGGSGCGKSTLLRHLIGLQEPAQGSILYDGDDFTATDPSKRGPFIRRFGVMYQTGALWTSLTLGENIAMPLEEAGKLPAKTIRDLVSYKLALVGLSGYEDYYPAQISGGMKKRAGIARAMALDPDILFLDLSMPRKNGFECLYEIKENEKLKHMPVVMFSTSFQNSNNYEQRIIEKENKKKKWFLDRIKKG